MKTILLIEDEKPLRTILTTRLETEGFNVLEADDGTKGLSVALEKKPDLILLDIIMPVMDGISMLKLLRKDDYGKTVPVILLTNLYADNETINKAIADNNPAGYLVKTNFTLQEMVDVVKNELGIL